MHSQVNLKDMALNQINNRIIMDQRFSGKPCSNSRSSQIEDTEFISELCFRTPASTNEPERQDFQNNGWNQWNQSTEQWTNKVGERLGC